MKIRAHFFRRGGRVLTLSLLVAAAAAGALPAAPTIERGPSGRWVTAHGFEPVSLGATPEASARAFVALHAGDLGVGPRQTLVLESAPAAGEAGVVRLQRHVDGWPVFGGGLALAVDAGGAVLAVAASEVEPAATGRFALSRADAVDVAVAALGGPERVTLPAAVLQGWAPAGAGTRAAYQVDLLLAEPRGPVRALIDAETGALLFARSRRVHAQQGRVYDLSPVEYYAAGAPTLCPTSGGGFTDCGSAAPVLRDLTDLPASSTQLIGSIFTLYNCRGHNIPNAGTTGSCDQSYAPLTGGNFDFTADPNGGSTTDDFAAVMAYYHLSRHIDFLKQLDTGTPNLARLAPAPAMPAFVNAYSGGQPYPNAFFDPTTAAPGVLSGRMVFGQDTQADFAYDASIVYHELTHGVVEAWGGYNSFLDAFGAAVDADAANEGTADAMAIAHTFDPRMSAYVADLLIAPGTLGLRVMGQRLATCRNDQGDTFTIGGAPVLYGLDGEPHDDGEVWGNFFWEVFDGLKGVPACGGACTAGAAIQYRALELSGGNSSSFSLKTYGDNFKAAAASLFPTQCGLQAFVQCAYDRHQLASCDRTLPVYAGETALSFVWARYSAYQAVIQTTGAATVSICNLTPSGAPPGTIVPATAWVRSGGKVTMSGSPQPDSGVTVAPGSAATSVSANCGSSASTVSLPGAGTWYLMLDSVTTFTGLSPTSGPIPTYFLVHANPANVAVRPAPPAVPAACVYAGETPAACGSGGGSSSTHSSSKGCGCGQGTSALGLLALLPLLPRRRRKA